MNIVDKLENLRASLESKFPLLERVQIKKRIKEIKSPLAGEVSGHIFFGDTYFGYDDALYASIRLLTLITNNIELDKFISSLPKAYISPEIKVFCSDKIKFSTIDNISKTVFKKYNSNDVISLDGLGLKTAMVGG